MVGEEGRKKEGKGLRVHTNNEYNSGNVVAVSHEVVAERLRRGRGNVG